jgi:hypothetical protein
VPAKFTLVKSPGLLRVRAPTEPKVSSCELNFSRELSTPYYPNQPLWSYWQHRAQTIAAATAGACPWRPCPLEQGRVSFNIGHVHGASSCWPVVLCGQASPHWHYESEPASVFAHLG